MNSKFAKVALPGLVIGLALGLSVPAVSFAQDDHHDRADNHGGTAHAADHGGNRGAQPAAQHGGFVGARTQNGAAVANLGGQPGAHVQARVGAGGQPGYHGAAHSGDYHGGAAGGGGAHFDYHGDAQFHGYGGVRAGFYFAPGRGYYHVPDQWYGHHWGRGEFLPRFFFSYRIYDPDYYDLPYPPYGCAWMFVGEDAVLVDLDTGQIIDVMYGVF